MGFALRTRHIQLALTMLLTIGAGRAAAQSDTPLTIAQHPSDQWLWISGQVNLIAQRHDPFTSPYAGPHSFRATTEQTLSRVVTLYTGARLGGGWEVLLDVESAGGLG